MVYGRGFNSRRLHQYTAQHLLLESKIPRKIKFLGIFFGCRCPGLSIASYPSVGVTLGETGYPAQAVPPAQPGSVTPPAPAIMPALTDTQIRKTQPDDKPLRLYDERVKSVDLC